MAIGVVMLVTLATAVVADFVPDRDAEPGSPSDRVMPEPAPEPGWVSGHVRDVNGNSIPRARVHVVGTRRAITADSRGAYRLEVPRRRAVLSATHPDHATQHVRIAPRAGSGVSLDFSLAATNPNTAAPNSAHRLIVWTGCENVANLSDEELDRLVDLGVGGFVCSAGLLSTSGGKHAFTADRSTLQSPQYELQRNLLRSAAVKRAQAGRLRLYLGFYASDATNSRTPFSEWFDDRAWREELLPEVRNLAAAARSLGFAGVAVDQELYHSSDAAAPATWNWQYPGNARPEHVVRAQAMKRGRQLMKAMLAGYPGLELVAYDTRVPGNWSEKVQEVVNQRPDAFAEDLRIDLWNGLTSVQGYSAIRWFDAIFYKTPHLETQDWSIGLKYNAVRTYQVLSQRFSNWEYASSRLHVTPFSWIDEGPTEFESARDPAYVETQLAAFRTWGAGGVFANYAYGDLAGFDYGPYADAMRQSTTPGTVDRDPPRLSVRSSSDDSDRITLDGSASDEFGIRVVRWYDARGGFGTAELAPESDDDTTLDRSTRWRIEGVPVRSGTNRITVVAEDLKGLARTRRLTVRR